MAFDPSSCTVTATLSSDRLVFCEGLAGPHYVFHLETGVVDGIGSCERGCHPISAR